jgi:hypothetical protein
LDWIMRTQLARPGASTAAIAVEGRIVGSVSAEASC